jgi:DNA-binding response OmpR family regulator
MEATASRGLVRPIRSARLLPLESDADVQTVTAQLRLSSAALTRLLSVCGTESRFVISSPDGRTSVQVRLMVSSVPDAEQRLGDGTLVLNWSRGTLARGDRQTALSRMEQRLLAALIDAAPGLISKADLAARLWPDSADRSSSHYSSLKVWIWQLRRHFAAVGHPAAISTVRGVGYRLTI